MFIEPQITNESSKHIGWIEVICGSMFSGKTEELIRRLNRARLAKQKLEIFKQDELDHRNTVSDYYKSNLIEKYKAPHVPEGYTSSWAQFSILAGSSLEREKIMKTLTAKKIPNVIYYRIPLHLQKVFQKLSYKKGDFPISEKACNEVISLPMNPFLTYDQINYVVTKIKEHIT